LGHRRRHRANRDDESGGNGEYDLSLGTSLAVDGFSKAILREARMRLKPGAL